MEPVFNDSDTNREFLRRGFVVRPFLDRGQVAALSELHAALAPAEAGDFYATVFSRDADYRRRVSQGIGAVMQPSLNALLPNHDLCFAVFVTKQPKTTHGRLPIHRDYSFVDARRDTAVHLWCPLVDVDETNGCLHVVPGSHTLVDSPYAVNEYPHVFGDVMELLEQQFTRRIPMPAGAVLAYEGRLFHGSGENRSDGIRPACVVILLPKGVKPRVYVSTGIRPTNFHVLEVTADFLVRMERGAAITKPYPSGVTYLTSVDCPVDPLRIQDLVALQEW